MRRHPTRLAQAPAKRRRDFRPDANACAGATPVYNGFGAVGLQSGLGAGLTPGVGSSVGYTSPSGGLASLTGAFNGLGAGSFTPGDASGMFGAFSPSATAALTGSLP